MQVGDVVTLTDARGENTGKVVQITPVAGMVTVLWDSGVQEQVHESELKRIGIAAEIPPKKTETLHDPAAPPPLTPLKPVPVESLLTDEDFAVLDDEKKPVSLAEKGLAEAARGETVPMPSLDDDSGYEPDAPKHPTFRERLSALWDSRPGK